MTRRLVTVVLIVAIAGILLFGAVHRTGSVLAGGGGGGHGGGHGGGGGRGLTTVTTAAQASWIY
jgi:hypothetical protein